MELISLFSPIVLIWVVVSLLRYVTLYFKLYKINSHLCLKCIGFWVSLPYTISTYGLMEGICISSMYSLILMIIDKIEET